MRTVLFAVLAFTASPVAAQDAPSIFSTDGEYLGTLSANRYDPNSVANPYGKYGSPYSPESINNPYGEYGNPYSPSSVTNPYATSAPVLVAPCSGFYC